MERIALAVFFLLLSGGVVFTACPSAPETPFRPDGGAVGDLGQACLSGQRCNLPSLACVVGDPATPVDSCRLTCNPTATDPCGAAFLCVPFAGTPSEGACVPAMPAGEPCGRCDDELVCITSTVDGGAGSFCRTTCLRADGSGCSASESCHDFGDSTLGYCAP